MRNPASGSYNEDGATAQTDDVVSDAKRCLQLCIDTDGDSRSESLEDLEFSTGKQWDEVAERERGLDGRPCLTINTLPATLNLVVNDIRQNRQSIHVHPVGGGADVETAEVMEGMCRHIEYDSGADAAYDTAVTCAAAMGFGYFRLVAEYVREDSFDQKLVIKRVRNPFTIYTDPLSQEADGSDMRFAIVTTKMGKAEFRRAYPKADVTFDSIGQGQGDAIWMWTDEVRIAEFYRIEETPCTLHLLSDGSVRYSDDKQPQPFGTYIVKKRASTRRKVMWYKLTALEVLEKTEVPCRWIPVFPVWGSEVDIDGRVIRSGIIRYAKDPSKIYNYFLTSATEEVALRTKTPFIGAVGQFETARQDWDAANNRSFATLEYDPVTVDGTLVGAPQRQPMADIPAGNLQMCAIARDNIKATTGIFDASLGARSNETSGRGIQARQRQGDIANFHYSDNLTRSIRHLGRCIIDYMPAIYDTERVVRILGEDGTAKTATINQPNMQGKPDKSGQVREVLNDIKTGEYDVVVQSGPSYSTLRQEGSDAMSRLVTADPTIMQSSGDLIVGGMDFPGASKIAARIAKGLAPGFKDEDEEQPEPKVQTPHGPMSIEEAGQLIEQSDKAFDEMNAHIEELEAGMAKAKLEAESRERVAQINADAKMQTADLDGQIKLILANMQPFLAHQAAALSADVPMSQAELERAQMDHQRDSDLQMQGTEQQAMLADQQAQLTPAPGPGAETGAMGQAEPGS